MEFATKAVHAGEHPDTETGAISTPIYQTSTYVQQSPGVHKGYEYARTGNPTRERLERKLAALENGTHGFAFGSGMAATSAVTGFLKQGDHVVVTDNVYGGTYRYFQQIMTDYGLTFSFVDTSNFKLLQEAVRPQTKMVFIETPTNPLLRISDLERIAGFCRQRGLLSVVDNTFLSPYFQRPLDFGIDMVVHSSTKYINGHSDVVGGLVVVKDAALAERLAFLQNAVGAVPSPFDCWLILRATKTLHLRLRQQNESASELARFLAGHPKVERVIYPGLETHPQHALARQQQRDPQGQPGFGGMLSFELGHFDRARTLLENVRLFSLAESLGGVESLISHPASMTHASVPPEERRRIGLSDGLVRISTGVEAVADLIADLEQALAKL